MTHGEELCSEMQQDSVVLTYLESVLMHQASGGNMGTPSTKGTSDEEGAACKTSISHSNRGGGGGGGGGGRGERLVASPSCEPAVSSQQRASKSTSALNVKKARLLQAEAWDGAKKRRVCGHGLEASDQEGSLPAARQSRLGKAQQQQHSTLLASLLQSFSSRLQNVALSQQGSGPRPGQLQSPGTRASSPEEDLRSYGLVSSHLRALLKNRDHSQSNHLPKENEATYQSPVDHQRLSGSPADGRSVGEPISCSARLRAVASMVENGARSASSPKPSVACSQLALLLSSDTQLQQYTREHSLGARAVPPSASERLAAIASQKVAVSSQPDPAQERPSKDRYRHAMSNGTSECQSQPEILERPGRFVDHTKSPSGTWEKSSRERNQTPMSPNSSSLLMHLLNTNSAPKSSSKNGTASANGHHWAGAERRNFPDFDYRSRMPAWEKPVKQEASSLEEAYSSDESSRSSCTPMDLSTKPRICEPISLQSRSLEQMTESLLFSWNPKAPGVRSPEGREDRNAPEVKSHQKVTLLQLLLGHQNGAKGSRTPEPQAPDLKNESPNSAAVHAESSLASSLLSRRVRGLETFQPSSSSSSSSSSLSSSLQAAERTPAPRITNSSTTSASRQPQLSPLCHASNGPHRIFARRGKPSSDRELSQNHQHLSKQQTAAEPAKSHHFLEPLLSSESAKAHQFPKQLLPMELAKNNQYVSMQSLTAESRLSNFSFSASKLLQDLAHTGFHKSPEASQADTENKNVTLGSVEARVRESSAPLLFNRSADSLCFQQSVLPESGDEQNRCTLQAGSTSSADLENLLERRSVLQLLLRTPEKDKVLMGNLHGRPGDQQTLVGAHPSETRCNGQTTTNAEPISMVKVKTEPVEEETGFSSNAGALEKSANFQLLMPSKAEEKHPSFSVDNVKQELASPPLSPSMAQSHSSQKGGVLSQLLQRDNNATLGTYTFSQHPNTGSLQEAPSSTSGSNSPCNVPKKRKILPASPTDLDNLQKTLEQGEVRNNHSVSSRGSMNGLPGSQGNGRISDLRPSSGLEFESRSNGKDTQGFNVLKQLLLSENGIKVLSQHRTIQNGGSPSERGSPCDPKLEDYHSTHFYSKRDLDVNGKEATRSYEPTRYLNTLPSSSSADNLPTSRAASDSECQAPYRGPQADSPWLTKTNPILYYMLQRGGSGREGQPFSPSASRGRAGEGEMARKERRMPRQHGERPDRLLPERRVKDEPADSPGYPRGREALTPPDLSENTCRILEKVVAIKREPD